MVYAFKIQERSAAETVGKLLAMLGNATNRTVPSRMAMKTARLVHASVRQARAGTTSSSVRTISRCLSGVLISVSSIGRLKYAPIPHDETDVSRIRNRAQRIPGYGDQVSEHSALKRSEVAAAQQPSRTDRCRLKRFHRREAGLDEKLHLSMEAFSQA